MFYQSVRHKFAIIPNYAMIVIIGVLMVCACRADIREGPPVVEGNSVEVSDSRQVKLAWEKVPGADAYNLYISKVPGAKENGDRISDISSPYTVTGLEPGQTYYFVVTSVADGLESEASKEISYPVEN
jgi:hypothetical protein